MSTESYHHFLQSRVDDFKTQTLNQWMNGMSIMTAPIVELIQDRTKFKFHCSEKHLNSKV